MFPFDQGSRIYQHTLGGAVLMLQPFPVILMLVIDEPELEQTLAPALQC